MGKGERTAQEAGHYEGVKRAEEVVYACQELGVEFLTLYTFSTENWKRPKEEIIALFELFENYLNEKVPELKKRHKAEVYRKEGQTSQKHFKGYGLRRRRDKGL
jgi:undecaprenyl diphosphate synthase